MIRGVNTACAVCRRGRGLHWWWCGLGSVKRKPTSFTPRIAAAFVGGWLQIDLSDIKAAREELQRLLKEKQ